MSLCMAAAAFLAGCAGGPEPTRALPSAEALAASCGTFQGRGVAPGRIGLPSGEAKVESAQWVPADAKRNQPPYCRLLGALAAADPERATAAPFGTINALSLAGHRPDGSRWVMFSFFGGGLGGNPETDGLSHANTPISTATIPPASPR